MSSTGRRTIVLGKLLSLSNLTKNIRSTSDLDFKQDLICAVLNQVIKRVRLADIRIWIPLPKERHVFLAIIRPRKDLFPGTPAVAPILSHGDIDVGPVEMRQLLSLL